MMVMHLLFGLPILGCITLLNSGRIRKLYSGYADLIALPKTEERA